jgi:hypothetical protein|tara:strand:+ start:36 stop:209 length:174 start_codon:yes stop_codon:yes gene_type:complete
MGEEIMYNNTLEIFWRRVASLHKVYEKAKDPEMKRMWKYKINELMRKLQEVDKRELN